MMKFMFERRGYLISLVILMTCNSLILGIGMFNISLIIFSNLVIMLGFVIPFFIDYSKRRKFFKEFNYIVQELDNRMYISSIIEGADFYEAELFLDNIYLINKQMIEIVKEHQHSNHEFKEYIELWCHEIKTPLATLKLIAENNKDTFSKTAFEELKKIEKYIDQVLYFAKSEIVENDYVVKTIMIKDVVNHVIKAHKNYILEKKIKIEHNASDLKVNSDVKWLNFIISQVVSNAVKYSLEGGMIKFEIVERDNSIVLSITDHGVGISEADLKRVLNKSFTGLNGRTDSAATGMGLFLASKMCKGLGHHLVVDSQINQFTRVSIIFPKGKLTEII